MKHLHTFESFLNEATTEFEFDPTRYAKNGVTVVQDEDYFRGRAVGKNYKFTSKNKESNLTVSRWYEGKAPDNYIAYLIVSGDKDKGTKTANELDPALKPSGSTQSSNGVSTFSFSRFDMSQKELEKLLTNFTK